MYTYLKNHVFQYILILILFAITVTAVSTPIDYVQKLVFIAISLFVYFLWAIWHHWEDHKLTKETWFEYIALMLLLFWLLITIAQ